jgi:aryl-alcohol dehydrogenase-like predicted oxidoreductase
MEFRNLGHSGLRVSLAGLGCNNFGRRCDAKQTDAIVSKALEIGVTLFDTADVYGPRGVSEEYLGAALAARRHDAVIATKFAMPMGEGPYWSGGSRRYICAAVEASLRRLRTDYVDLYQMHRPDPDTPIDETMRALDDLLRAGKVRYIGCSNFTASQVVEAQWSARHDHLSPFVSAQNLYNLLDRRIERELVPVCGKYGLGLLPYFPLASGFLTGKYQQGRTPPAGTRLALMAPMAERVLSEANFATLGKLESFAASRGRNMIELALGWLATQPFVSSVIAGATSSEQLEENVRAVDWRLTADEMAEVNRLTRRGPTS